MEKETSSERIQRSYNKAMHALGMKVDQVSHKGRTDNLVLYIEKLRNMTIDDISKNNKAKKEELEHNEIVESRMIVRKLTENYRSYGREVNEKCLIILRKYINKVYDYYQQTKNEEVKIFLNEIIHLHNLIETDLEQNNIKTK